MTTSSSARGPQLIAMAILWGVIDVVVIGLASQISPAVCLIALATMILQVGCLLAFLHLRAAQVREGLVDQLAPAVRNLIGDVSEQITEDNLGRSLQQGLSNLCNSLDGVNEQLQKPVTDVNPLEFAVTARVQLLKNAVTRQTTALLSRIAQIDAKFPTPEPDHDTLLKVLKGRLDNLKFELQPAANPGTGPGASEQSKDSTNPVADLVTVLTAHNARLIACCTVLTRTESAPRNRETITRLETSLHDVSKSLMAAIKAFKKGDYSQFVSVTDQVHEISRAQRDLGESIITGLKALPGPAPDIHIGMLGMTADLSALALMMNDKADKSVRNLEAALAAEKDKVKQEASENAVQNQLTHLITHDIPQETIALAAQMQTVQAMMENIGILWSIANEARGLLRDGAPVGTQRAVAEFMALSEMNEVIHEVLAVEQKRWPSEYRETLSTEDMDRWEVSFNDGRFAAILKGLLKNATDHGKDVTVGLEVVRGEGNETFAALSVTNSVREGDIQAHYAALKDQIANPMMRPKNGRMHGGTFFLTHAAAVCMSGSFQTSCSDETITVRFLTRSQLRRNKQPHGALPDNAHFPVPAGHNGSGSGMQLS